MYIKAGRSYHGTPKDWGGGYSQIKWDEAWGEASVHNCITEIDQVDTKYDLDHGASHSYAILIAYSMRGIHILIW